MAKHVLESHPQKHVKVIIEERWPLNFVGSVFFNTFSAEKNQARKKLAFDDFYAIVVYFLVILCICLLKFDKQNW